jgi:hypothetical protein
MDSNTVLAAATVVLAAGTLVLVGVTAYYASQNHNMVGVLKRQADLVETTEVNRQRDAQIQAVVILQTWPPSYLNGPHTIELQVANPSNSAAVLGPRLILRAAKEPVAGPNWETPIGSAEMTLELANALLPGEKAVFRGVINDFVPSGEAKPGRPPLWPEQIVYDIQATGVLGQSVLQRYEWRPEPKDGVFVRLRLIEITPNVAGSTPLRITTDKVSV